MTGGPFQRLHQLLATEPAGRVTEEHLRLTFAERELQLLRKHGIFARTETSSSITCPSCDEGHFIDIQVDETGKSFVCCNRNEAGPCYLVGSETNLWRHDVSPLLSIVADKLQLKSAGLRDIANGELWTVGVRHPTRGVSAAVLFSRTEDISKLLPLIDGRPLGYANTVIFTPLGGPVPSGRFHVRTARIDDFIEVKTKGLGAKVEDFDQLIAESFRKVTFTPDGDIVIDGQLFGSLPFGSVEYWFFDGLMAHFGSWVLQDDIMAHCANAMGRDGYEKTAQNFCADVKYRIKKMCGGSKIVDKMIVSGPFSGGKNGVRIIEPR